MKKRRKRDTLYMTGLARRISKSSDYPMKHVRIILKVMVDQIVYALGTGEFERVNLDGLAAIIFRKKRRTWGRTLGMRASSAANKQIRDMLEQAEKLKAEKLNHAKDKV